jgi:integrase
MAGRVWTVERWLRLDLVEVYLRPTALRGYREHVHRYLLPNLGYYTVAELGTRDVQQMLRGLAVHRTPTGRLMAPATISRILATLRTALAAAVREGLIAVNPAAAARAPRPIGCHPVVWTSRREQAWRAGGPRPPVAVWDTHHLAAFLRGCRDDRFFALWWLAALCGLRRGELCGLTWSTVDLDEQTLTVAEQVICVDGKTHVGPPKSLASRRTIALDDATAAVLRHHRRLQQAEAREWTVDSRGACVHPARRATRSAVGGQPHVHPPRPCPALTAGAAARLAAWRGQPELRRPRRPESRPGPARAQQPGHHRHDLHQRATRTRPPPRPGHRSHAAHRSTRQTRRRQLASMTTFTAAGADVVTAGARRTVLLRPLPIVEVSLSREAGTAPGHARRLVFLQRPSVLTRMVPLPAVAGRPERAGSCRLLR